MSDNALEMIASSRTGGDVDGKWLEMKRVGCKKGRYTYTVC